MIISASGIDTMPTTPNAEKAFRSVFPDSMSFDDSMDTLDSSSSNGSIYEESFRNADTLKDVWEIYNDSIESLKLVIGEKKHAYLVTELFYFLEEIEKSSFPFALEILSAIDVEPVEDGFQHPVEALLIKALLEHQEETIDWLYELLKYENNASIVASILKCLGRLDLEVCKDWGFDIVRRALNHKDVEVRDAAAQSLELWGTTKASHLLKKHHDDVPWLQDYIERVIHNLEQP